MKSNTFRLFLLAASIICILFACSKHEQSIEKTTPSQSAAAKQTATAVIAGAQSLPGGKTNFSVTLGNMDATPWVRIGNWTFNGNTGTVNASFWTWSYDKKFDVPVLSQHRCTFDGVSKIVNNYTPYGWIEPAGVYANWSGNYTYNTGNGRLTINWTSGAGAGHTEQWDVSLPDPGLARVKFVPGSSSYHVTHGRGYGSNTPWPNNQGNDHPARFKTISEVPSITVTRNTGRRVAVLYKDGTTTIQPAPSATITDAWERSGWGAEDMTYPSSPDPKNCKHKWVQPVEDPCTGACATNRTGIMYHLISRNNNRQMSWVHFCACLPHNGDAITQWPGYGGNMHPSALMQILDDNSNMRGVIGIESQNPPSTGPQSSGYPNFQMQLFDFTTLPGS